MKHALIASITGQDDSYLTEFLLDKGYLAKMVWDESKLDGTPRKLMDTSNLHNLGWKDHRSLFDGISHTYESWLSE